MRATAMAVIVLVVAATAGCGGDGDDADGSGAGAAGDVTDVVDGSSADDGDGESGDDEMQDVIDGLDFGDGGARVTIGNTTYEFELGGNSTVGSTTYMGVCQTLFGMIAGTGYDTEGRAITIDFEIPPPDWETYEDGRFEDSPPRIEIENSDDDTGWLAGQTRAGLDAGSSQIVDWESDGDRASGTATFVAMEPWGAPVEGAEPVTGSFELGCG
ncbi:hypothetical protein [Rhabdothermincola salaria]|uniref:hypothetical protein n=1 Tax=Rhabdothermincola salaria TaxID=2903142 RepID=UPI001E4D8012|nr:hypothetical protein [Rhabdothermincola salaria]MCD9624872.1 hypothetical protein [Rhabdothermincola salaria]